MTVKQLKNQPIRAEPKDNSQIYNHEIVKICVDSDNSYLALWQ
jgi:hypothetical protein